MSSRTIAIGRMNYCLTSKSNLNIISKCDHSIGIPLLLPLTIQKLELSGERFTVTLTDVLFDNFKDIVVTESELDLKNNKYSFVLGCKYLYFIADYTLKDGQILTRTPSGDDRLEMSLMDNIMRYSSSMPRYPKDDQTYLKSTDSTLTLKSDRMYFNFENDGQDIAEFLRENWKVLQTKVLPGLEILIKEKIDAVMTAVQENSSIEETFIGYS
ncbi:hemolymph juvenile hormone binding protein (JHBP) [Popillia japonica]|uniref:Hemolymph juvenile hormone binding protein (JHBP) n=1 Tax=Popillia japonica TaxID=7064 RepID=A0AAW1HR64_POPJA